MNADERRENNSKPRMNTGGHRSFRHGEGFVCGCHHMLVVNCTPEGELTGVPFTPKKLAGTGNRARSNPCLSVFIRGDVLAAVICVHQRSSAAEFLLL